MNTRFYCTRRKQLVYSKVEECGNCNCDNVFKEELEYVRDPSVIYQIIQDDEAGEHGSY